MAAALPMVLGSVVSTAYSMKQARDQKKDAKRAMAKQQAIQDKQDRRVRREGDLQRDKLAAQRGAGSRIGLLGKGNETGSFPSILG